MKSKGIIQVFLVICTILWVGFAIDFYMAAEWGKFIVSAWWAVMNVIIIWYYRRTY